MKKHILMIIAVGIMIAAAFASVQTVYADSTPRGCIAFTSSEEFEVILGDSETTRTWDGTVQVSLNGTDWHEYDPGRRVSAVRLDNEYSIFFRGINNSYISTSNRNSQFQLFGTGSISCTGSIENLLNYSTAQTGGHPRMEKYAFQRLFMKCRNLTEGPELTARTLASFCYSGMFSGCTNLRTAPQLPATALTAYCYDEMFSGCTGLTEAPKLPATTLGQGCYNEMFYGCTNIETPPALPATSLPTSSYKKMFASTGIKLSSETGTFNGVFYGIPYRFPAQGEGSASTDALNDMFANTKGPFTGTPVLNQTYYLPVPVPAESIELDKDSLTLPENGTARLTATILPSDATCSAAVWSSDNPDVVSVDQQGNVTALFPGTATITAATADGTGLSAECQVTVRPEGRIILTSDEPFTVSLGYSSRGQTWDGTVQVSPGKADWEEYVVGTEVSAISVGGKYSVSFRGEGNHHISNDSTGWIYSRFTFSGSDSISCSGNIENLLDHATVESGGHPVMDNCAFNYLFSSCVSLTQAPELPAQTLTDYCYSSMFAGCTSLTEAPELPAQTLAERCYSFMFYGCTGLTEAPELPAQALASECYYVMFKWCTSLTKAPKLPAETLAEGCYSFMFEGCTNLTQAPALPAQALASACYENMFLKCTGLTAAPRLPAQTLARNCYSDMFKGCTSLTEAPELPAETLADNCYSGMFSGCTSLAKAPQLPAMTLTEACYAFMFNSCTNLRKAPKLPATTLAGGCYDDMFAGCTSLSEAPELPSQTLDGDCYYGMFKACTNLRKAPALPAQTLAEYCYEDMFKDCTGLREAPELPATKLDDACYASMFEGCSSLTMPPELPATETYPHCYDRMFASSGIKLSSEEGTFDGITYNIPYRIPKEGDGIDSIDPLVNMFADTGGPFTGTPELNKTYYLAYVPDKPDVYDTPLTTMKAKGRTALTIAWAKVDGADGYDIFFAKCSKKDSKSSCKRVKTVKAGKPLTWTKTKLKKKTTYKAYVKAYIVKDGKKTYVSASPLMHVYSSGGTAKYTNVKAVTVNKSKLTLTQGKTFKLKAKLVKLKKNRKLMPKSHVATLRYLSTDKTIAAVSSAGKITAKSPGTCYIYAYAHNGINKKVKVTVQ